MPRTVVSLTPDHTPGTNPPFAGNPCPVRYWPLGRLGLWNAVWDVQLKNSLPHNRASRGLIATGLGTHVGPDGAPVLNMSRVP